MKKNTPLISVLVPICNVEKYLPQCLESIANQTLKDIEVICINDGSTDNSKAIIESFVNKYPNFKLIDKENSGYGASMNQGLNAACGEYIGIVESDDFIKDTMFEELYKLSENGTIDVVKGNFWDYFSENDTELVKDKAFVNMERAMIPDTESAIDLYKCPQMLFGHPSIWSGIYKRELIEAHKVRFMEAPGGGWVDNPFFFEMFCTAKSIKWTNTPYYYYRKTNPNSSSNKQTDLTLPIRRMMDNLDVLDKYNINDEEILKMAYSRALMYIYGVLSEPGYSQQADAIKEYTEKMMQRVKADVVLNNFNNKDKALYYEFGSPSNRLLKSKKEKILIYNWIQFDNPRGFGGGVNIYCRNLIDALIKNRPDIEVWFLSSGFTYDASTTECYIRPTYNIYRENCKTFEIVNSPVPSAQDMILNSPSIALESSELKKVIKEFIEKYGEFKAIHFNNIEGLSLDVLELKKDFKETQFIYSVHNYIPFCLHGFYYNRDEKCVCSPGHSSEKCRLCTEIGRRDNIREDLYQRAEQNVGSRKKIKADLWIQKMGFSGLDAVNLKEDLCAFEKKAIKVLNENMDYMLAVSERVRELSVENGLDTEKVITSYIGTKVAEFQNKREFTAKDKIKVVFLGNNYFFEEKGAPFLISSLKKLDRELAKKVDILLTFTNCNDEQIKNDLSHFSSVSIVHGYQHHELRNMLLDCDLGIVPVLWEDNLPQIAIEMVAMGVPVLASSLGGASELCSSDLFKYEGGNSKEFLSKLEHFINNPKDLELYWDNHASLVTMNNHLKQMEKIYDLSETPEQLTMTFDEYCRLKRELDFYRNVVGENTGSYVDNHGGNKYSHPLRLVKKTINSIKQKGIGQTIRTVKRYIEEY